MLQHKWAAKLFGDLDTFERILGLPPFQPFRAVLSSSKELVREKLGEEAWQKAYDEGHDMRMEEAIECTLQGCRAEQASRR